MNDLIIKITLDRPNPQIRTKKKLAQIIQIRVFLGILNMLLHIQNRMKKCFVSATLAFYFSKLLCSGDSPENLGNTSEILRDAQRFSCSNDDQFVG